MNAIDAVWSIFIFTVVPASLTLLALRRAHRKSAQSAAPGKRPGIPATLLFAVVAGIAIWLIWLSWGDYYTDASGHTQGPYRPWQVIACGLTVVTATAVIGLWTKWPRTGPFAAAIGTLFGFAAAWGTQAFLSDPTGLAGVGMLMLLIGGGIGLGIVAGIVAGARNITYPRRT